MITCPIASMAEKNPHQIAVDNGALKFTYKEIHEIVCKIQKRLSIFPSSSIAFIPQKPGTTQVEEIAFFFAAWRCHKTVYPLSFRLLPSLIKKRLQKANASFFSLEKIKTLSFSDTFEMHPLYPSFEIDPNLIATYLDTSGSSGFPKIVCHPLKSHLISAFSSLSALNLISTDRYLLNLPLFHVSGLSVMLRSFLIGATLLLTPSLNTATHVSMVPTQLFRSLELLSSLSSLRCLLIGGAPLSPSLREKAEKKGLCLKESYGMTETSAMAFCEGKPLSHIAFQIEPKTQELLLQSPALFSHYLGEPLRDETIFFATSDLAHLDPITGRLKVIGRKDRQFICGGENIQPEEIENALLSLSAVEQACVYSIADEEFGYRIGAKVVGEVSEDALRKELSFLLPSFKIPSTFVISPTPIFPSKLI